MYTNLMIDIETMGLSPKSAIIQIAAVPFSKKGELFELKPRGCHNFEKYVKIGQNNNEVNHNTLAWWLQQDYAREMGENLEHGSLTLFSALYALDSYIDEIRNEYGSKIKFWAKNSRFDFSVLNNAYLRLGNYPVWEQSDIHCAMKLFKQMGYPGKGPKINNERGKAHDALSDCFHQIHQLKYISDKHDIEI